MFTAVLAALLRHSRRSGCCQHCSEICHTVPLACCLLVVGADFLLLLLAACQGADNSCWMGMVAQRAVSMSAIRPSSSALPSDYHVRRCARSRTWWTRWWRTSSCCASALSASCFLPICLQTTTCICSYRPCTQIGCGTFLHALQPHCAWPSLYMRKQTMDLTQALMLCWV